MIPADYPALSTLVAQQLAQWPEHRPFLQSSFKGRSAATMGVSQSLSAAILALAQDTPGGLTTLIDDYRYLCEVITLPEEIYFRRHGRYRLTRFEDANAECYSNAEFMARYMNGLLLSNVFWANHDPTTLNSQGPDHGTQYRSVVFFHSPEQQAAATASKAALDAAKRFRRPIVTQVVPAATFYAAEDYHQRYLEKRGLKNCHL